MLLKLTTITAAFLIWVPVAQAWTWPVQGPVLAPFSFDPAQPYAAGQHRGIDIGAGAAGDPVVAPASGAVSFAGSVPTSGKCVTIETPDGYSVTLTHLDSIAVAKGASVSEGAVVGTVGPSGTAEEMSPYVHLGIRQTAYANAYLDPVTLLPALPAPAQGASGGSSTSAGSASGSSSAPAPTPAPASEPAAVASASPAATGGAGLVVHGRPAAPHPAAQSLAKAQPRATATQHRPRTVRHPVADTVAEPPAVLRRPLEEPSRGRPPAPSPVEATPAAGSMSLALGVGPGVAAALAALATMLARRRRRHVPAAVLRFPGERQLRRAA